MVGAEVTRGGAVVMAVMGGNVEVICPELTLSFARPGVLTGKLYRVIGKAVDLCCQEGDGDILVSGIFRWNHQPPEDITPWEPLEDCDAERMPRVADPYAP